MAFHTPHGSARYRLPWSWSAFDYRELCEELWAQCGEARFEIAKVERPDRATVVDTDRGDLTAPLIVDALGWRRVLGPGANVQPPEARISRGLEVHPQGGGVDLDVWIDRSVVRYGYAWSVPAAGEQRVGVGSYEPRHHVKEPTREMARRLGVDARPLPGQLVPARAAAGGRGRRVLRRRLRRPLPAAVGRGHPHRRSTSGSPAGASCAPCSRASSTREQALARYAAFSAAHAPAFRLPGALQRLVPALPPRRADRAAGARGPPRGACRRAFGLVPRPGPSALRRALSADAPRLPPPMEAEASPTTSAGSSPCVVQDWAHGRGADAGLHERGGARAHAGERASCTSTAARAASCGTRARPRATPRRCARCATTATPTRCSRSSTPPAPPATPASARASTAATWIRAAPHEVLPGLERTIAARAPPSAPRAPTPPSCSPTRRSSARRSQEEAEEVARAAREESDERVAEEAADVLYHLAVLLRSRGLELADAERVLDGRRR